MSVDMAAVVKRSRGVSARLNGGIGFLMKKNKIDVIWGEATIAKAGQVVVSASAEARRCSRRCRRPRARSAPGTYRRSTSSSRPAPARASCRASSRTAS
jgi:dihydrolipoamide dehydrogenase